MNKFKLTFPNKDVFYVEYNGDLKQLAKYIQVNTSRFTFGDAVLLMRPEKIEKVTNASGKVYTSWE